MDAAWRWLQKPGGLREDAKIRTAIRFNTQGMTVSQDRVQLPCLMSLAVH